VKTYLNSKERGLTPETIWFAEDASTNEAAKSHIKELFDGKAVFETPKPVPLLETVINIGAPEGIVLDFFAGSCPLPEAIMRRNAEDGGSRKFIAVQLPEPCEDGSEAQKAGYAHIAQIGRDRIKKAANIIGSELQGKLDLNRVGQVDLGFKAFDLSKSNFGTWDSSAVDEDELKKQIEMHIDHLSQGSSAEDVLFELLLKAGFLLTTKVEAVNMAGKQVFSIENGSLLICLEKDITTELIDALADANPLQVICLDEGFKGNDQLKANAVQTFNARAQAEESEIVFKTV
jgi:adenine-specific DNA-methyltransferase